MKKTLHILSLNRQAGVEVMFLRFLQELKNKDEGLLKNQLIYCLSINSFFEEKLKQYNIKFYKSNGNRFIDLWKIYKIIIKEEIDNLYGQNFLGNFLSALVGKITKKNSIAHEHGTAWKGKGITYILNMFWVKYSNIIVCNSKATLNYLKLRYSADPKKLILIYNGISPENSVEINEFDKDGNLLLYVGRLDHVKSPQTLIYTLKYLKEFHKNLKLLIVGDGPLKEELIKLSKKLNVDNDVTFLGYVEDPQKYMRKAAVLLLPSIRESLGNVIIEAALQKTPTVASKVDGIPELIKDKETGVLVKPTLKLNYNNIEKYVLDPEQKILVKPKSLDPYEYSIAISEVLQNNKYIKMGINAREYLINKFSLSKYVESLINIIK